MATIDELRLEIDELRLPEEWIDQPRLFYRWSVAKADADRAHAEARSRLDVVKAELDAEVRTNPEAFEITGKATIDAINNTVAAQPKYRRAAQAIIEAKHAADIAGAAVAALDHRKRALQALVDLHGQEFYAQPRAPRGTRDDVEAMEKRVIRGALGRRERKEEEDNHDAG